MTAPRVDLFAVIHKMLRVSIFDTAALIARADFTDPTERRATLDKFDETFAFLTEHHQHEDLHVMPVLTAVAPDVAQGMETDHSDLDRSLENLERVAASVRQADAGAALRLGAELHLAFSVFLGDYLKHMASEEVGVNAALWEHLSDDALVGVRAKLQGAIPPARFAEWFAYMVPAMNVQERIGVLTGIKLNAPPAAFEALGDVARSALGKERWSQVESSLPG